MTTQPGDTTPAQPAAPSTGRIIALLSLAAFASTAGFRVCDAFLPQLADEFDITTGTAALAITVFAIAYGLLQFFFGPAGDRYGKVRVLTYATLACAIGSAGAALSPTFEVLLVCRFLSGATGAGIIPMSMAWIGDNVPYEERQTTLARFLFGLISGVAAGQVIGGVFADLLSWRWAFAFLAAWFLCTGLLLRRMGAAADAMAPGGGKPKGFLGSMQAVVAIPWARLVLIIVFLEGALVFGAFAFVPSYLQLRFGLSPSGAGLLAGVYALGGLGYVLVSRRLVSTLGEAGMAGCGGIVLSLAFLTYCLGNVWMWALLAGFICGFGYYLLHSTLQTHATQMAPAYRGTAVSLFAALLFVGQSAGVAAGALVVDKWGAPWLFAISVVLCPLLGLAFVAGLKRRAQPV